METDSISEPNGNEYKLKKIKVEPTEFNVLPCNLSTEPKDLADKKPNIYGVSNKPLHAWNYGQNEMFNKMVWIKEESHFESKDLIREIKTEPDEKNCMFDNSMRIKLEVKSYDYKDEGVIVPSRTEVPYDLTKSSKFAIDDFETRLDKIPKDILGKYGIIMEESEAWIPSEPEVNEDDDDDDGKLVINEECKAEILTKVDVPVTKGMNGSLKEKTSEFTNIDTGELQISNVMSLEWDSQCDICGQFFPTDGCLSIHRKGHCSFPGCLDYIENEAEREKHLQGHRANPAKPFRCDLCKKRFHYYRYSKKHRVICKVLKRSKCPHCKYGSSKPNMFNKHVAKHLDNLTCTDCSKTYNLVKNFTKHLRDEHRKRILFQCTECPKSFDLAENIVDHIELHGLNLSTGGLTPFIRIQVIDPL